MRNGFFASMATLLTGAGLALAQPPQPLPAGPDPYPSTITPVVPDTAQAPSVPDPTLWGAGAPCADSNRVWASGEYLLWWIKDAPLPASLVTTGPVSGNPGALNAGGVPVFGSRLNEGAFSGARVTVGCWLDADDSIGIEGSGFILPRQTRSFASNSDANGNPVVAFRYQDPPNGAGVLIEDAFQAAIPGMFAGGVGVVSSSRLWGAEANAVAGLGSSGGNRLQMIAGFRYLDLDENLDLLFRQQALAGNSVPFQGTFFPAPSTVSSVDTFHGRTQFYGGQVGLRGEHSFGNLSVKGGVKVGLGDSHEVTSNLGASTLLPAGGPPVTVSGGQFSAPSNMGRFIRDEFAVVPEVELNVGYQVTSYLRAFVGYDFLYWSRVVRPGDQIDLVVDTRRDSVNPGFVPGTTNTAFPRPTFHSTDYWAQGLTFGLEFRY